MLNKYINCNLSTRSSGLCTHEPTERIFTVLKCKWGVTLAQLVKASVGQADVQRFEPHLGHNWLSCGVFLVKSRHFGLPLAQTIWPNWQSLLAGGFTHTFHEILMCVCVLKHVATLVKVYQHYCSF